MAMKPSEIQPFPLPQLPLDAFEAGPQREAVKKFNSQIKEWHDTLNGGLSLGTGFNRQAGHVNAELIAVTVTASAADFPVAHNLERVPFAVIQLISESAFPLTRATSTPAHSNALLWFQTAAAVGTRYWILVF